MGEIVVGVDGSGACLPALHWAAAQDQRSGSRLRAAHVVGCCPVTVVPAPTGPGRDARGGLAHTQRA